MKELINYPGYYAGKNGHIYSMKSGRSHQLSERMHHGYYWVNVADDSHPSKTCVEPVHKLILEAFVGPCPEGHVCLHLNGNSLDNRLSNLHWGTRKDLMQGEMQRGTAACLRHGENSLAAKLTEADVHKIISLYEQGYKQREIAEMFSVTQRHISDIVHHKTWKHLWSEENKR